jgi:hypothetical protein
MTNTDCIRWAGNVGNRGYGRAYAGPGRYKLAHRAAYEQAHGAIPEGHVVHHTCENRLCVNPEHLVAMSPGTHSSLHAGRPERCKQGHAFTDANTWVSRRGHRYCRRCKADRMMRYRLSSLVELAG